MLASGSQVGNYVIETHIGGGGMAQLYRVRHQVLGTLHALKVLDAGFREMAEVRSRFLTEGVIAAKLNHPNVVKVTDTVSTEDVAGLVMELVMGPNLEQYIRRRKSLPNAQQIRELFLPVLAAIGAAHRRGIIHRDIKPANILLEEHAGHWVPKVTDFGIAKVVSEQVQLVRKKSATQADARMGTLAYMSPEQIRGATLVTAQSDIFSLGATLCELATCEVAFDGNSDYDVMHQIVQGQVAKPDLLARIDPLIAAAIKRALAPQPELRFGTCEEFAEALSASMSPSVAAPTAPAAPAPPPAPAPPSAGGASSQPPSPASAAAESGGAATRLCPFCNERILASAKKCKHCLEFLEPGTSDSLAAASASLSASLQLRPKSTALLLWEHGGPALLSAILPGLGQLISNRSRSALLWFAAAGLWYLIIGTTGAFLIHAASAVHAFMSAKNSG